MSNIFDLFRKIGEETPKTPITHIVCGLGNPGKEYEYTRHNMGFIAIDRIAEEAGTRIDRARFHALTAEATVGGVRVLLMKPETFMNNSGVALSEAMRFYKIPPESVIVLCDDISFAPGHIRIRKKGSAGGHNGLKSLIEMTGSSDFMRVRIGVGQKPSPDYDLVDWVLGRFPAAERDTVVLAAKNTADAVRMMLEGKTDLAMSKYSK